MTDSQLARCIAESAGAILLKLRDSGVFEGKALGNAGDRTANAFILDALRANQPDDAILSEEENDGSARHCAKRVWIVDPLDGTREFSEGRSDWAVHIGLSIEGAPAAGAVALPALGLTFCTGIPQSIPPSGKPLRILVSRTRPAAEAVALAEALSADLVPMGSAGAKAMAIIRGEADIYLHSGGQYEWDNCAPAAVALASGLHASRADGTPLTYNGKDAYLPDLLICRPEHRDRILAALCVVTAENSNLRRTQDAGQVRPYSGTPDH